MVIAVTFPVLMPGRRGRSRMPINKFAATASTNASGCLISLSLSLFALPQFLRPTSRTAITHNAKLRYYYHRVTGRWRGEMVRRVCVHAPNVRSHVDNWRLFRDVTYEYVACHAEWGGGEGGGNGTGSNTRRGKLSVPATATNDADEICGRTDFLMLADLFYEQENGVIFPRDSSPRPVTPPTAARLLSDTRGEKSSRFSGIRSSNVC